MSLGVGPSIVNHSLLSFSNVRNQYLLYLIILYIVYRSLKAWDNHTLDLVFIITYPCHFPLVLGMSIKTFESALTDFSAEYDGHKAPRPLGGRQ